MISTRQAASLPFAFVHARNVLYGKGRWLAARLRVKHFAGMILQHGPVQIDKPSCCTKAHVLFWFPHSPKLHYLCFGTNAQVDLNALGVTSDNLDDIHLIVILESDSPFFGESQDTRVETAAQKQKCQEHPVLGSSELFHPDNGTDTRTTKPTNLHDSGNPFPTRLPGTEIHPHHQSAQFPWTVL
jgi:hypothetical protein